MDDAKAEPRGPVIVDAPHLAYTIEELPYNPKASTHVKTYQEQSSHCAGLGVCEILTRTCIKIAENNRLIAVEEIPKMFVNLYVWYLDRMAYDTKISDDESISFDWLSIFVHELNYGFGEVEFDTDVGYVIIKTITQEPVLPHFHFLQYENNVPHFPKSDTTLKIFSLISRIQKKLVSNRQQININVLYPNGIPSTVNAVDFLFDFIDSNVCCIDLTFDGQNETILSNPEKGTGIIRFNPKTMVDFVAGADNTHAHTMMVHHVERKSAVNDVDRLALTNTWHDWGHKTKSAMTGRTIDVGYVELSDEIVRKFLNSIFYLSIVNRSVIVKGPPGNESDSYLMSVGGTRCRRKKIKRIRRTKSKRRRARAKKSLYRNN